jgi:hypothetical protein
MAYTLNQIVKKITDYGNQHAQIEYVLYGDVVDHLSLGEVTYPAFFFNMSGISMQFKQITYTFSLYFLDRQIENTEQIEVQSDQIQICQDIVAQIRNNSNEWIISENIPMDYFCETEPDVLAGVKADISITVSSINNRCQIPV